MDEQNLAFLVDAVRHPLLDIFMLLATTLGFLMLPGAGLWLHIQGRRREGLLVLFSITLSICATLAVQFTVLRDRPEIVSILKQPKFPSFPSGHAAAAGAVLILLGLSQARPRIWLLLGLWTGSVMVSRIYLGHHFVSDVFAGAVLGGSIGAAVFGLSKEGLRSPAGWRWLIWPQFALVTLVSMIAYLDLIPSWILTWPITDKVAHFFLFGTLAFWLHLATYRRPLSIGELSLPFALVLLFPLVMVEEASQSLSALRGVDAGDLISNWLGLTVFWFLADRCIERHQFYRNERL